MPKTKADKFQLGLEFINDLYEDHICKSFHSGPTGCMCISSQKKLLPSIRLFFQSEIKEFWDKPEHVAVRQEGEAIEYFFGQYLLPHCSLDSKRPGNFFTIANKVIMFCMNTVTKIFGLGQLAMTKARELHLDNKAIGLNPLKKACWLDMKKNPDHKCLYCNYHEMFKHQVVPMSHHNPQAIQLIKLLGGFMIELD